MATASAYRSTTRLVAYLAMVLGSLAWIRVGYASQIGPDRNLCEELNGLAPGQELLLQPGDYAGPCAIRHGGHAGAPVVIRAADPTRRPRIVFEGAGANVIEVRASHVTLRDLDFGPTRPDVDAVRIVNGDDIVVEDCHFSRLGGIAVVANHVSLRGLRVARNVIHDSRTTAMYFGCHDGATCVVSDLVVADNEIRGVTAIDPEIGYGIQVKLNSSGVIRGNRISDTKGPGIMVYGARSPDTVTLVEGNFVMGSRTSSGIVLGGGPAVVRNNIAVSNLEAGIGLEDYRRRGLLRLIDVVNNTVYGGGTGGINVPETVVGEVRIVGNAAQSGPAGTSLPKPRPGLSLASNVDCRMVTCFTNPGALDFSPLSGSVLSGQVMVDLSAWIPERDFLGVKRGPVPTVGAIEGRAGPGLGH